MNYKEFKEAILAAANDETVELWVKYADGREQKLYVDEWGIKAPEQYPGIQFVSYGWGYLEHLAMNGSWENYPGGNCTVMKIYDREFQISVYKKMSLDTYSLCYMNIRSSITNYCY